MRQQLKWLAYFLVVAFGTQLIVFELIRATVYPEIFETVAYTLIIRSVFIGYPVVIGIAILRYRLYDIDIIIRRTLVYALVTGALALVDVGSIVLLQQFFVAVTGQQSTVAIVVSTLLIAALLSPLRQRVQVLIDRRFYRRHYDIEQTLAEFQSRPAMRSTWKRSRLSCKTLCKRPCSRNSCRSGLMPAVPGNDNEHQQDASSAYLRNGSGYPTPAWFCS